MIKIVSGHCPYLNKEHSITVEYGTINVFQSSQTVLRTLDCNYSDGCNVRTSCPLKQKAESLYK